MKTHIVLDPAILAALSDHDWQVARSWTFRGASYYIGHPVNPTTMKPSRKWGVLIPGVTFPTFDTKETAYEVMREAFHVESVRRAQAAS